MTPQANARIWWDPQVGSGAYRMTVPYNPTFNELFKNIMPHSDRSWSPESKTWTFTERYFDAVKALIEKTFGNVIAISRAATEKASQPPPVKTAPLDSIKIQFFSLIPYESMQKAYLNAANILHPDHGGDMDKMANLNACWQRLKDDFYKTK